MPHDEFSEITVSVTFATNGKNARTIARSTLFAESVKLDPQQTASRMLRRLADDITPQLQDFLLRLPDDGDDKEDGLS